MGFKFQHEEPKEGQATLGFVVHTIRYKMVMEEFPDLRIQGWVVVDEENDPFSEDIKDGA